MKKSVLLVLALLLLAACGDELPPNPPPPGGDVSAGKAFAGLAGGLPKWAAEAKNTAVTPNIGVYSDSLVVSVSNFDYIYSSGYIFNSKVRTWEKFELQGERAQNWVKKQALGSFQLEPSKFVEGENYLVVYACSKVNNQWECNGKKWMLVAFKVLAGDIIPESAYINQFVINARIAPFEILSTKALYDNFTISPTEIIYVVRYDARYREPKGLAVQTHVFDFKQRRDVDRTLATLFKDIVASGTQKYKGQDVAVFLDEFDHRVAVWSSGKEIIYVETFDPAAANKEVIEGYLAKYPSDLKK